MSAAPTSGVDPRVADRQKDQCNPLEVPSRAQDSEPLVRGITPGGTKPSVQGGVSKR